MNGCISMRQLQLNKPSTQAPDDNDVLLQARPAQQVPHTSVESPDECEQRVKPSVSPGLGGRKEDASDEHEVRVAAASMDARSSLRTVASGPCSPHDRVHSSLSDLAQAAGLNAVHKAADRDILQHERRLMIGTEVVANALIEI